MDDLIKQAQAGRTERKLAQERKLERAELTRNLQRIPVNQEEVIDKLIDFLENKVTKTELTNQLDKIEVTNLEPLVEAVINLHEAVKDKKEDLSPITELLSTMIEKVDALPTEYPDAPEPVEEVKIANIKQFTEAINEVTKAINSKEYIFEPIIKVSPTPIKVEKTDVQPLEDKMDEAVTAIKEIKIPEPQEINLKPLERSQDETNKLIRNLKFPSSNYILPFKNAAGAATQVQLDANGNLPIASSSSTTYSKPTDKYSVVAISDDGTYKYFWFEDADLNYYVMRKHKTTKVFAYTKGTGGYAAVYVNSTSGPSGSPTFASYGATF